MAGLTPTVSDSFDGIDSKLWNTSNYTPQGSWIDTRWSSANASANGELNLSIKPQDIDGKHTTGAELQSKAAYGYGLYEIKMQVAPTSGTTSTFFVYSGPGLGTPWNEVDIEATGKDTHHVSLTYHTAQGDAKSTSAAVPFDTSTGLHDYAIEWTSHSVKWYADGQLLREDVNPSLAVPKAPAHVYESIWAGIPAWLGPEKVNGTSTAHYDDFRYYANATYDQVHGSGGSGASPSASSSGTSGSGGSGGSAGTASVWLYDADTGQKLVQLKEGGTVDASAIDGHKVTAVAGFQNSIASVVMNLDNGRVVHTENAAPYALMGDGGSTSSLKGGVSLGSGAHNLELDVHSGSGGQGSTTDQFHFDFTVSGGSSSSSPAPTPAATSTTSATVLLVDTATGQTIQTLHDGDHVSAAAVAGKSVSLVAVPPSGTVADNVHSAVMNFDHGAHETTENIQPYTLYGDDGWGNYASGDLHLSTGAHDLAISFDDLPGGHGMVLGTADVAFTVG